MTISSVRNRRQKAHDRLLWMEGVKVIKPTLDGEPNFEEQKVTLGRESGVVETRSSSLQRGTDAGTAREGGETERAESMVSAGSKATGTQLGREVTHANLGEEITSVVRRFPRVNFEKASNTRSARWTSLIRSSRRSTSLVAPAPSPSTAPCFSARPSPFPSTTLSRQLLRSTSNATPTSHSRAAPSSSKVFASSWRAGRSEASRPSSSR